MRRMKKKGRKEHTGNIICANIDHHRSRLDPRPMHIFGFANSRNENVCILHLQLDLVSGLVSCRRTAYNLYEVLSLAVALSNSGIPATQYRRNGTTDDVTSTKYDSICSRKRDTR